MATDITFTGQWGPNNQCYWGNDYPQTSSGDGAFQRGDVVFNATPSTSGVFCWVCCSGGTPGTWKTVSIGA
jgi:hypothetical protein